MRLSLSKIALFEAPASHALLRFCPTKIFRGHDCSANKAQRDASVPTDLVSAIKLSCCPERCAGMVADLALKGYSLEKLPKEHQRFNALGSVKSYKAVQTP